MPAKKKSRRVAPHSRSAPKGNPSGSSKQSPSPNPKDTPTGNLKQNLSASLQNGNLEKGKLSGRKPGLGKSKSVQKNLAETVAGTRSGRHADKRSIEKVGQDGVFKSASVGKRRAAEVAGAEVVRKSTKDCENVKENYMKLIV